MRRSKYIPNVYIEQERVGPQTTPVLTNGNSQAVRLPRELRFDSKEVAITRVGDMVVLLPRRHSAEQFFSILEGFELEFAIEREQPSDTEERAFPICVPQT